MARFFIDRPVFAWVVAILIMLAGLLSVHRLPQARLPRLAPPVITMSVTYDGANADTVQDSITQVIEQNMSGVDDLLYMSSNSSSEGRMVMRLTFDPRVNVDTAQMQVQNRLQRAMRNLPDSVNRQGVLVRKVSDSFLQRLAFFDRSGRLGVDGIADFVSSVLMDPLTRIDGVGDATLYAAPYAMRIWLDPRRLLSHKLTPADVVSAIEAQNRQVAVGQIGGLPVAEGQELNVSMISREHLRNVAQFERIVVSVNPDGSTVRVGDVARVAMGQQSYMQTSRYKGMPSVSVGIQLSDGANAVETAERIDAFLKRMEPLFPEGLEYAKPYDTVPFIKVSIGNVARTLAEAVLLVSLTIFLFLQDPRATLIPTLAVPVVLLGTFGVMAAFGFSINTLTMFGLVLAIGLLVDDAIVVVENAERLMATEGLSPYDAVRRTMEQVTGALIGVAAVLSAVFVPMAFFGGMVGGIYRQFSVTIVSAMTLSVVVAIVFTPPLCVQLLRPRDGVASRGLFGLFNRFVDRSTVRYRDAVRRLSSRPARVMAVYAAVVAAVAVAAWAMPTGFLPVEDQGTVTVNIFMPPGSTREATMRVVGKVERYFAEKEGDLVDGVLLNLGAGPNGSRGQHVAQGFVDLRHWDLRKGRGEDARSIAVRARRFFAGETEARITFTLPPEVPGLGQSSGISLQLQDLAGIGHEAFVAAREELIRKGNASGRLLNVRTPALDDVPQLRIDLDDVRLGMLGLTPAAVNASLGTAWGGNYVNDFVDRNRVKRVYVQADAPYRMNPDQLGLWHFRNDRGEMVPLDAFASTRWTHGPAQLERYNGFPSFLIEAAVPDGGSSGAAMDELERLVDGLPDGIGFEWTGLSYQERLSGSQTTFLYVLSLLVVFLSLAALYESWSVPIAVMMVVPVGALGAFGLTMLRGLTNDIYFRVGLLAVVGLSAKNAILIVEFARSIRRSGAGVVDAAAEAARIRLRPIVMTSAAFLIGVLPLTVGTGAGAGSRHAIGTGIVGGTFMATFAGIFFIPVFFVVVSTLFDRRRPDERSGG